MNLFKYFNHYLTYTHWDHWYDGNTETKEEENMILYENKLIGRPRIRQVSTLLTLFCILCLGLVICSKGQKVIREF